MREHIEQFTELGASVVAIAPHTVEEIAEFVGRHPSPFPIVADPEHGVFDSYDVGNRMASLGQRPALFVIDGGGTVRFDSIGTQQWQIPTIDQTLAVVREINGR